MSTDDATGKDQALGVVLDRLMARLERQKTWARTFRCTRIGKDTAVPCVPGEPSVMPMIDSPMGQVRCPLVESEPCGPGILWREWTRGEEDRNWQVLAPQIGIQRRYWGARFGTARQTPAIKLVEAWLHGAASAGQCLVLLGDPGIGKTYAASCALRAFPGLSKMFWNMADLASELMSGDDRRLTLNHVRECRFLVLDDIGGEYMKVGGLLQAELDGLIVFREASMLATLMTSRLRPDQLRTRLSESVIDRLNGRWAEIQWVDGISLRDA